VIGSCDIASGVWIRFVRRTAIAVSAFVVAGSVVSAQTNIVPHSTVSAGSQAAQKSVLLFPPPEFKLHDLPVTGQDVSAPSLRRPASFTGQMGSSSSSEGESALFARIEREGSLKSSEPVFNSEIGRKIDNAFRPEILRIGHVKIYSSIVTAIARKNPLCLLSPVPLDISF
jgi:hypothetical protein